MTHPGFLERPLLQKFSLFLVSENDRTVPHSLDSLGTEAVQVRWAVRVRRMLALVCLSAGEQGEKQSYRPLCSNLC